MLTFYLPPPSLTTPKLPFSQLSKFPNKPQNFHFIHFPPLHFKTKHFPPLSLAKKNDFENEDIFHEDEDEEGEFVPLMNMKKWLEEKPSGFGEGKEYDTTVEEKLLQEIQQSREAQLANLNKLKNNGGLNVKKENNIASSAVPAGFRVRLSNLPRKKNIDRDLQKSFKGIPGIVSIIPAVSGNKKTREPVCKGFAFVDLKTKECAHRFAQVVSGQSISFGKIEKQIKCDVLSSKVQNSALEQSIDTDFGSNDSSSDSLVSISSKENENTNKNMGHINLVSTNESVPALKSSKQPQTVKAKGKKKEAKPKTPKVPKLNVPGSANRLKVREKAMLTGVLSKYAAAS